MFNKIVISIILFCSALTLPTEASYVLVDGTLINSEFAATLSLEEHYQLGLQAYTDGNWKEAVRHFQIVTYNAPSAPVGQESFFYLGVALFYTEEYDLSNEAFSDYLKLQSNPKYFENAMEFKYNIAEALRLGACRRFFGTRRLPKWASGKTLAKEIYEQIIHGMPGHQLAAQSAFSKGVLLWSMCDYRGSVESFQLLIRRFPKHELAPESYAAISSIYLEQAQNEFQNPDVLALAQINLRRFSQEYPRDDKIEQVKSQIKAIKEEYARGFYETGQYYERIYQPEASIIYYNTAINTFPETVVAERCRDRIESLIEEMEAPVVCQAWNTAG